MDIIDDIIGTMAAVLATTEGLWLSDEGACIITLINSGYRAVEIGPLLDQARAAAQVMRGDIADALAEGSQ
jgi:hypothetical protein